MSGLGVGRVVSPRGSVRRGPSYMKAVLVAACFEAVLVAAMNAAGALAPGGWAARLGVWLHWPALCAARELEAVWMVAFFQVGLHNPGAIFSASDQYRRLLQNQVSGSVMFIHFE